MPTGLAFSAINGDCNALVACSHQIVHKFAAALFFSVLFICATELSSTAQQRCKKHFFALRCQKSLRNHMSSRHRSICHIELPSLTKFHLKRATKIIKE